MNSSKNNNVFQVVEVETIQGEVLQPGWYYWDEAGLLGCLQPYATEQEAIVALYDYGEWLNSQTDVWVKPI
jgi:hypothetical protein